MIHITVVENDDEPRRHLAALFTGAPGFALAGAHASAEDALHLLKAHSPHVFLVDINLGGMSGIDFVRELMPRHPGALVLMLTISESTERIFEAIKAGAHGYLLKPTPPADIVRAATELASGGAPMTPSIARKVILHLQQAPSPQSKSATSELTERERTILLHVSQGKTFKEIGGELGIETSTVSVHMRNVYQKLHVRNRTEAVVKFLGR